MPLVPISILTPILQTDRHGALGDLGRVTATLIAFETGEQAREQRRLKLPTLAYENH